jgi:light-regulated signal transduction histidine kinase (bacteriophytochrome)
MPKQRLRIQLIDDSPADAAVIQRLLRKVSEIEVEFTHYLDAESGLPALAACKPDCLLLDYHLGKDDGLGLLSSVRELGDDVPVVVLTGAGNEAVAVEAMQRGAQDYLIKDVMGREDMTSNALQRAITRAIEKVELERRIADQRAELEAFVSVASHDLKTPLCVAKDNIELIREFYKDRQLDAEGEQMLASAFGALERTIKMLDSLVDYSRMGRSSKTLVPVDLDRCMRAVEANLQVVISESGTKLVVGAMPAVLGDEDALIQLVQNLSANAIKFSNGAAPMVRVESHRLDDRWRISVQDNGIGIDPIHQKDIFAPFKRLHSRQEFEGSGIGLATCKRIVEQHGGEIWVESERGRGATFQFTLQAA